MKLLPILLFCSTTLFVYSQDNTDAALRFFDQGKKIKPEKGGFGRSFPYFLKATRLAQNGTDLQLKAIYEIAYLYNYAEEKIKPEILRWESVAVAHLIKTNRRDTLAADLFFRGGIAFMVNYRVDSALMCFEEAKKRYSEYYGNESSIVSDCYHLIGDVYLDDLDDYSSAENFYERALTIAENKADTTFLSRFKLAKLYSQLSQVNQAKHDYQKALAFALKNVTFAESIFYQKKDPLYGSVLEAAYSTLAIIYTDLKEFSKAREILNKNILFNRSGNGSRVSIGFYQACLGETFLKENLPKEAISYFKKADLIYNTSMSLRDIKYISCLEMMGNTYLMLKEYSLAKASFYKAMSLIKAYDLKKSGQAAGLYRSIGNYYQSVQNSDSSLIYYQKSLIASSSYFKPKQIFDNPSLESIDLKDYAYEALVQKAIVLGDLYKTKSDIKYISSSLQCFRLAETLLNLNRSALDSESSKWGFFDSKFNLYEQVILMLYENQKSLPQDTLFRTVFHYMESSKSKMLTDALNEAEFADPLMYKDSLVQFLNIQKRYLYLLNDKNSKLENADAEEQKEINNAIIRTDRAVQLTERKIAEKYPSYVRIKYKNKVPSLKEIQSFLKQERIGFIEYFWGEESAFALAIDEEELTFLRLGAIDTVKKDLQPVLSFLASDKNLYSKDVISSFVKNASRLYGSLIKPFSLMVADHERIIIIPDGPLGQLPFEVLVSSATNENYNFKNLDYFVRSHTISYSFSSAYLLQKKTEKLLDPTLLAFGFTNGKALRSERSGNTQEIIGTETELIALKEKFPNGDYFFGADVTEKRFKEQASSYDLIHLAVHGQGDTEQDYAASLFFRDSNDQSDEDGELHWYELFGMRLRANLVVISSCESGIGKNYRGEGMLSMAGAFAFAGCKNIVMGLWKVDDQVSVQLMDNFYKNLQEGEPVDIALTEAKRNYLEDADDITSSPKLWASLTTYGSERIIENDNHLAMVIYFVLFITALGSILLLSKKKRLLN